MRRRRLVLALALAAPGLLAAGFVANGLSWDGERPELVRLPGVSPRREGDELVVATWNLAKLRVHEGGLAFAEPAEVRRRIAEAARVLAPHDPDLVFLTEVVRECGPCPVDQVAELARELDLPFAAFGEEKRFGLPFYRLRSGNAVLSRTPLRWIENQQLPGERPFYAPTNNRRVLWLDTSWNGIRLRLGAVRNDSFDLANNARQVEAILARIADDEPGPVLLAGDFNAEPHDPSMRLLAGSGLFLGPLHGGEPTFPSRRPTRRIDFVLAPAGFRVIAEAPLESELSDHLPVVARLAP